MKSFIKVFTITSILFAACNSKSAEPKGIVGVDTTGLYKNNMVADTAQMTVVPGTTTKKVVETHSPDGSVTTTTTTTSADKPVTKTKTSTSGSVASSGASTTSASQPVATAPARKKGWSNRAKGAAIGGVGGAVAGAVISKKKGKGAIIGGLAGAAGGYIIGNEKDKKVGR